MARDIPEVVPDSIAHLVYERWGDMKAFSVAVGLPYTSVYSVLVKSAHRPLLTLEALAKPLRMSMDELAHILLIPDLVQRQDAIERALAGKSLSQWAREAGMSKGTLHAAVNNLENSKISNSVLIAEALELDLKSFLMQYRRSKKVS